MSLSLLCRLFGRSRQSLYQARSRRQELQLAPVRELVEEVVRRGMPRLGTRKLHLLLSRKLQERSIKLGRDGLFAYLRAEQRQTNRPWKATTPEGPT